MRTLIIISAILFSLPASAQMQMLFGRNVGAGITSPLDVDSIFYWFDAGQGVTTNNSKVTQWNDLSGNGHNVTQADTSKAPSFEATGGPNSRPTLVFDGTNDCLISDAHLWESDDITIFVIHKFLRTTDGAETVISHTLSTTNQRQWQMLGGGTGNARYTFQTSNSGGLPASDIYNKTKTTTWEVFAWVSNASTSQLYVNNASQTKFSGGPTTIFDVATNKTGIGCSNASGTPIAFINAEISEIIIYSRALTTAERQAIENYLNKKYNLY
jgi:hypothetical protein